jgi:hypothetical protein
VGVPRDPGLQTARQVVRQYLVLLETGEVPGVTAMQRQLDREISRCDDVLERLGLVQARIDATAAARVAAEDAFIGAAGPWGAARGVTWRAWREVGVPAEVLARAGIARGGAAG